MSNDAIYQPAGQAFEFAELATNPYQGCGHACAYCYVPRVLRGLMTRAEFDAGAIPRENFIVRLRASARRLKRKGIGGQVLLSFTTDPYHPGDTSLTRETLFALREEGFAFGTLTKGGTRALRDLDLFRRDRDCFAATLTSLNDDFSRKWERRAAPPSDRVHALRRFHDHGIFTFVSLEPVISIDETLRVIRETHPVVDLYKVGRINYNALTDSLDWRFFTEKVIALLHEINAAHYIKRDLQDFLPAGYHNPLRVPQHN